VRPIDINLATRPFRNNTLLWAGFGFAALALAALTVLNVWIFLGYGSTMRQHRQDFTSKDQRRDSLARDERLLSVKLTKLDFKGLSVQSEFANDAILRRTFSWTRLFNRLEVVVPPTVMMTAIRPEIQAEGISIVAEGTAKDQEALLRFEENLIRDLHFARIYPGSERREQRGQDLRFSLKFDYVPESPEAAGSAISAEKEPAPPKEPAPAGPAGGEAGAPAPAPAVSQPVPPPRTVSPPIVSAAAGGSIPPAETKPAPGPSVTPAAPPAGGEKAAAPPAGAAVQQPPQRPRGGPRPAYKPGQMRAGARERGAGAPLGRAARRAAELEEAARFNHQPIQAVFDYLMKNRGMTFLFSGDFDLRQKVTMDLNGKEEEQIVEQLAKVLDSVLRQEGPHAYRLSPKSGGEPLEEPPVEVEPAPDDAPDDDAPPENPPPEEQP
jgi:Tfp pilus assembly protein PilN